MKTRKIPLRKCLGCMEQFPKKELARVVRSPEGETFLDLTGKANGRGAYICKNSDCLKKAVKSGRLDKVFEVKVPKIVYEQIEKEIFCDNQDNNE